MEKQEQPQQQQRNTNTKTNIEDSLQKKKKPLGISDRSKRDEWSEGAVSSLLDAYESKWVLRNRAKLKGQDWEDVARHVSSRAQWSKAPKTQTQCKNKIESMKKRYRTESAAGGDPSSWPLFRRLDLLLRCGAPPPQQTLPLVGVAQQQQQQEEEEEEEEELPLVNGGDGGGEVGGRDTNLPLQQQQLQLQACGCARLKFISKLKPFNATPCEQRVKFAGLRYLAEDAVVEEKQSKDVAAAEKAPVETDSSTPICNNDSPKTTAIVKRKRGRREEGEEVAESVRWLAEVVVRSEQARLETMRELERMRGEAESRKGEIDLKRTEIMANAQLEIARLLVGKSSDGNLDSSLRIGKKNS
ncbi:hypothetical protein ACLOJK_024662 [Asimina triloba]